MCDFYGEFFFFSEMDQVADELSSVLVFHNEDYLNLNQCKTTAFQVLILSSIYQNVFPK